MTEIFADRDALEERAMDARFDAHQDRLADEQDQRDQLGFDVADLVTVGNGKTQWVIESFSTAAADGTTLAHLQPTTGYTGTTVTIDRLRAVSE
jgi:hypothetical protein